MTMWMHFEFGAFSRIGPSVAGGHPHHPRGAGQADNGFRGETVDIVYHGYRILEEGKMMQFRTHPSGRTNSMIMYWLPS